jgi:uncharacterized UBP type Zn finger protein
MREYYAIVSLAGRDVNTCLVMQQRPQGSGNTYVRKEENMAKRCTHLDQIQDVTPSANGCEDCLKIGDTWVHLRLCLSCGHVGCCDDSKNKHATRHFHATNHPIIQSFEPGEDWIWCYIDQVMLEPA